MGSLRFSKDPAGVLRGAESLVVIAPEHRLKGRGGAVAKALGPDLASCLADLRQSVSEVSPQGTLASTRTQASPGSLHLVLLPQSVSRHNAPSRAEAARSAIRKLAPTGKVAVVIVCEKAEHAVPLANAVGRAVPLVDLKSGKRPRTELRICCVDAKAAPLPASPWLKATVEATREAARLVDSPPTDMNPTAMVREARSLLRGLANVSIKEIKGPKLLEAGLGGIHAVGRTAVEAPRMLVCSYSPRGAKGPHVALVGKGVTYDTGGLHLKPRGGMETMKADMGGSAAVLGAFRALVATKVKRKVTLLLCLAENAIGPAAYKPDDVITLHSGKTVEINNTDAEGRLLLADGVSYAARNLKADVILDAATLTGAQLIATGNNHAAVVSDDAKLEAAAVAAGQRSGDLVHPLPFAPEFYRPEFDSPIADMRNSVKDRGNAQSSCAAIFVHWQLPDDGPRWCHVDLAGPAFREDRGTGFGVALLSELAASL